MIRSCYAQLYYSAVVKVEWSFDVCLPILILWGDDICS